MHNVSHVYSQCTINNSCASEDMQIHMYLSSCLVLCVVGSQFHQGVGPTTLPIHQISHRHCRPRLFLKKKCRHNNPSCFLYMTKKFAPSCTQTLKILNRTLTCTHLYTNITLLLKSENYTLETPDRDNSNLLNCK